MRTKAAIKRKGKSRPEHETGRVSEEKKGKKNE